MYATLDTLYMNHRRIVHSVLQLEKDCIPPPTKEKERKCESNL